MNNNNKKNNYSFKLVILLVLLGIIIVSYGYGVTFNLLRYTGTSNKIYNNIYVGQYDVSGIKYSKLKDNLDYFNDSILEQEISFNFNGNVIKAKLKDFGVSVDIERIVKNIKKYQKNLNYSDAIKLNVGDKKKVFPILYTIDKDTCINYLNNLKSTYDVAAVNGYFDTSNGVKFVKGTNGYSLDTEKSYDEIYKLISNGFDGKSTVDLIGNVEVGNNNESYESIDTLTSSFSTNFNLWEGTRPTNLRTALSYINGAIVEPGEVFSFYKYAGPFNKSGYVFYYEFVGNGVCQIATTTYNAALLGGLEIVKRYPHAKKSVYVDGGLDATVASYSSGWYVDMQFKNTYKYPIYIKAYANGGTATVEFWSNSNAKEGKTYSTESVKIGTRGYNSYRYTYDASGNQIDKSLIATTWYTEE